MTEKGTATEMNNNLYSEKIRKHRKFKFGAFAVGLTVTVIALVIAVNAVFSSLAAKFMWYTDMTKEKIYGISEATHDLLDAYNGSNQFSISIVFCKYADQLDTELYSKMVHNIARKYEEEFDFVEVEYVDILNHPDAVNKYLATSVSTPKTTSVYVVKHDLSNPEEDKKQSKIYTIESFFKKDQDTDKIFAFDGEYKLTSAILQLFGDSPTAYFVEGHGEKTSGSAMWSLLDEAGYNVKSIDLSKEEIDDSAKLLIINSPDFDYMGASDTTNEIKKISDYLNNFGAMMVFMDPTANEMPELDALFNEWGIEFAKSQIRDYENSLSVNGDELVAELVSEGTGSQITKFLRELDSAPKAVMKEARPINITFDLQTNGTYASPYGDREISVVLQTSSNKTAEATSLVDNSMVADNQIFNLMTLTVDTRYVDNEAHSTYILAAGSSSFVSDSYIGGRRYANRDIMLNVMKSFGKKTVPLDISYKTIDDEALTITTAAANRLTVIFTVVPSVVVFGIGIAVYSRRRYL